MKVCELIEELKKLPSDAIVVRRGYEGGVSEASEVKLVKVELNVNTAWYYGKHEIIYDEDLNKHDIKNTAIAVSID